MADTTTSGVNCCCYDPRRWYIQTFKLSRTLFGILNKIRGGAGSRTSSFPIDTKDISIEQDSSLKTKFLHGLQVEAMSFAQLNSTTFWPSLSSPQSWLYAILMEPGSRFVHQPTYEKNLPCLQSEHMLVQTMQVFLHIVSRASELTQDQDRLPNIVISKGYVCEPSDWNSSGRFGFALSVLAFLQVFYCFLNFGLVQNTTAFFVFCY